VPLGLLGVVVLIIMYFISVIAPQIALRNFSLIPSVLVALAWLMVLQAHNTPFTAGANDNASGVGVLLAIAERVKTAPFANTEVWFVATGCEEVGAYGSADFVRRHAAEFHNGAVLVVDNIGAKDTGPVYLDAEGILLPAKYTPEMLTLAKEISHAHPELGARPFTQQGAYTDGYASLKAGLQTLTFVGYTRDGWIPNWHNPTDVFANVDAETVERTEQFVLHVLKRLDRRD
jgi:Zn-dependent M28 family amino/carboxypeptidase